MPEPHLHIVTRLLNECAHWQAINETTRPISALFFNAVPEPCEDDGDGFATAGGDVDQARFAFRVFSKPALVVEWRNIFSESSSEELMDVPRGIHWLAESRFIGDSLLQARFPCP